MAIGITLNVMQTLALMGMMTALRWQILGVRTVRMSMVRGWTGYGFAKTHATPQTWNEHVWFSQRVDSQVQGLVPLASEHANWFSSSRWSFELGLFDKRDASNANGLSSFLREQMHLQKWYKIGKNMSRWCSSWRPKVSTSLESKLVPANVKVAYARLSSRIQNKKRSACDGMGLRLETCRFCFSNCKLMRPLCVEHCFACTSCEVEWPVEMESTSSGIWAMFVTVDEKSPVLSARAYTILGMGNMMVLVVWNVGQQIQRSNPTTNHSLGRRFWLILISILHARFIHPVLIPPYIPIIPWYVKYFHGCNQHNIWNNDHVIKKISIIFQIMDQKLHNHPQSDIICLPSIKSWCFPWCTPLPGSTTGLSTWEGSTSH